MGIDKKKLKDMTATLRRVIESCPTEVEEIPPGIYIEKPLSIMGEESKKKNKTKKIDQDI